MLLEYLPWGYVEGFDNTGHAIDWNCLGNIDGPGLVLSSSIEEMTRYKVRSPARRRSMRVVGRARTLQQSISRALRGRSRTYAAGGGWTRARNAQLWRLEEAESRTLSTTHLQITVVTDLHNLSSRHLYRPALKFYADTEKMVEDYYPEFQYKVLIIRAPAIFGLLFGMVKHVFDADTLAKFEVVPGDPLPRLLDFMSKVREPSPSVDGPGLFRLVHPKLTQAVAAARGGRANLPQEVIPVEVGGLREYRDPRFLCFGGPVPEKFYKTNDDSYDKITVAAGAVYARRVEVVQAGSTIAWDFFTSDYDISFGVFYVPAGANEQDRAQHRPVVPLERVNAHTNRSASITPSPPVPRRRALTYAAPPPPPGAAGVPHPLAWRAP